MTKAGHCRKGNNLKVNKAMGKFRNMSAGVRLKWRLFAACLLGILAGVVLHWALSPAQGPQAGPAGPAAQRDSDEAAAVWTCSMHPQIRMPKPGLCPICNMELIPLEARVEDEAAPMRRFTTSEAAKALMNIETAPVERRFVTAEIRMVGKVEYDETRLEYITAWVPGRLDRLYVDYTGVPVKKGDHMVYLYSPELLSAQEELLQTARAVEEIRRSDSQVMREVTAATLEAAREKLRLWGLTAAQVAEIEERGTASDHITIYAPAGGIVVHKNAQEGMYVDTGTRIYTVADLSHVWVKLDAYESDLSWLRYGQEVEFTTVSFPGDVFSGTISFIDPVLDPVTRTVKVRVDVPNADGRLKPQMFVRAAAKSNVAAGGRVMDPRLAGKWICPMHPSVIKGQAGECDICGMPLVTTESLGYASADPDKSEKPLVIPASAALVTGTRAVVYVEVPDSEKPTYDGREIVLGPRAGDFYIVRSGLAEGQRVVTRGNFKIDSALQIEAKPSMMTPAGGGAGAGGDGRQLPAVFRKQLGGVVAASELVLEAVGKLEPAQVKLAFEQLEKTIRQVDAELLHGTVRAFWKETSMLLANDAVEGKEAATMTDAQKAADSLRANVAVLKSRFGLRRTMAAEARTPVDPAFRAQLGRVYKAYFTMQEALAADEFEAGLSGVGLMKKALEAVDMKLLSGGNHELWMKHNKWLQEIISGASGAGDIESLRRAFALLSEQLFIVGRRFGPAGGMTLYKMKCPMAFNNRGAEWLQRDTEIRNPYFGSAMLKCGSVIDTILPDGDTDTEAGGLEHGR